MYTLLKNRRVPGELKTETMYRFPDVTRSPVREVSSWLSRHLEKVMLNV